MSKNCPLMRARSVGAVDRAGDVALVTIRTGDHANVIARAFASGVPRAVGEITLL